MKKVVKTIDNHFTLWYNGIVKGGDKMTLKELRISKGFFTLTEFAQACGICKQQLSLYEIGKFCPSKKTAERIAKALGVEAKDVVLCCLKK